MDFDSMFNNPTETFSPWPSVEQADGLMPPLGPQSSQEPLSFENLNLSHANTNTSNDSYTSSLYATDNIPFTHTPLSPSIESTSSAPDNEDSGSPRRKGSNTATASTTDPAELERRAKATAHSLVEKRYRTSVNSGIRALEECIPQQDRSDILQRTPTKAAILAKGVTYIRQLEREVAKLKAENARLRTALEQLRYTELDPWLLKAQLDLLEP